MQSFPRHCHLNVNQYDWYLRPESQMGPVKDPQGGNSIQKVQNFKISIRKSDSAFNVESGSRIIKVSTIKTILVFRVFFVSSLTSGELHDG